MSEQWRVDLDWGWGQGMRFNERHSFHVNSMDEIDPEVRRFIGQMVDRYAFDCGRIEHPLNPWLYGLVITPVGKAEYRPTNQWDELVEFAVNSKRAALAAIRQPSNTPGERGGQG